MILTKKDSRKKAELVNVLGTAATALEEAKNNNTLEENKHLITDYNVIALKVQAFVDDVAGDFREKYDNKSDEWRDSDDGQAADEFINAWESFSIEEADDEGNFENMESEFDSLPEES
jgi:hypothetical protein